LIDFLLAWAIGDLRWRLQLRRRVFAPRRQLERGGVARERPEVRTSHEEERCGLFCIWICNPV